MKTIGYMISNLMIPLFTTSSLKINMFGGFLVNPH